MLVLLHQCNAKIVQPIELFALNRLKRDHKNKNNKKSLITIIEESAESAEDARNRTEQACISDLCVFSALRGSAVNSKIPHSKLFHGRPGPAPFVFSKTSWKKPVPCLRDLSIE
jgi:hypothetical protein